MGLAREGARGPAAKVALLAPVALVAGLSIADCRCAPFAAGEDRRVVDCHTHIRRGGAAIADGIFVANGVRVACNLTGYPYGKRLQRALRDAAAMETRVLIFAGVPWRLLDEPDFGTLAAEDLRRSYELGARGLKISKALGLAARTADGALLPVDTPLLDPVWTAAGELGIPVAIHTGDPAAFFEPPTPDNERYEELAAHPNWSFHGKDYPSLRELMAARDRMVERHPKTTFIAVHVGGFPEDLEAVAASMRAAPNLLVDLAARLPEIGRKDAAATRAFFKEFQDRILFGTDLQVSPYRVVLGSAGDDEKAGPEEAGRYYAVHWRYLETRAKQMEHVTPIQGRWKIDGVGLSRRVLDKVYRGNAGRVLGLQGP